HLQNTIIPGIGDKQLGSISTQRKAIGTKRRKTSGRQEAVMFDSDHVARPIAFACAVDLKDRSLERVRNIKIAVSIESKRVGGRKAITAKHDSCLGSYLDYLPFDRVAVRWVELKPRLQFPSYQ